MLRRVLLVSTLLTACYDAHDVVAPTGDVAAPPPGALDPAANTPLQELTYYRDIKPIIDQKCTQCHVKDGMGGFPLTSYDEIKPLVKVIKAAVTSEKMPPWRASGPLDTFLGDRRLTPERKAAIASWVDQGAPAGLPEQAPPPVVAESRKLPRVDLTLPIPGPYTPVVEPDDYRCFVLEWPYSTTKFITGLSVEADNKKMVHHAIVYQVTPESAARSRQRDADDPGPGYSCFGVDTATGKWLTSYEPGGYGEENPGGVGFEVQPGSQFVLQMHYNTLGGKESDSSKVEFMLADEVQKVGNVSLIMNPLWAIPNLGVMRIPADQPDVKQRWQGRPSGLANDRSYDVFWVDLHMHKLGKSGTIGVVRAGSNATELLLDVPSYSFEWQETYRLRQPTRINPGDQLFVECHFDNTAENQTEVNGKRLPVRDVTWGEGTTDEMCLGNVLATPVQ